MEACSAGFLLAKTPAAHNCKQETCLEEWSGLNSVDWQTEIALVMVLSNNEAGRLGLNFNNIYFSASSLCYQCLY
jgi:hypothetical protein